MLITILVIVAVVIVLFTIIVSSRPAEFAVTRTGTIAAPPAAVFPHVNSLRKWEAWSPWAKIDPNAKYTYEGPAEGVGSVMSWDGNNKVGAGRMTITESKPSELVRLRLEFLRPMRQTNTAEFTFRSEANQTVVVWTMTGRNGFAGKLFGMIVDCEKMVGRDFEKGLASLKGVVEGSK